MKRLAILLLMLACLFFEPPTPTKALGCFEVLGDTWVEGNCVYKKFYRCCGGGGSCVWVTEVECY